MSRAFYSALEIRNRYPGHQALILQSPAGKTLLLKVRDELPEGKWCIIATVGPNG